MYGLIVDVLYMLMFSESISIQALVAVLASGLPFILIHGVSTVFFLAVLAHPMIEKLERVKLKFGLAAGAARGSTCEVVASENPGRDGGVRHSKGHGRKALSRAIIRRKRERVAREMEEGWFKDIPSIDELAREAEGTLEDIEEPSA
jgi:hypothetical protein